MLIYDVSDDQSQISVSSQLPQPKDIPVCLVYCCNLIHLEGDKKYFLAQKKILPHLCIFSDWNIFWECHMCSGP